MMRLRWQSVGFSSKLAYMKPLVLFLAALPAFAQVGPVITSVAGAGLSVPAVTQVTSGGIVSIFGTNLTAGVTHALQASDLNGNNMPTNLGSTCVQVGGVAAALYYVSPTQINAQMTAVGSSGTAQVTVIANCGTTGQTASQPFSV